MALTRIRVTTRNEKRKPTAAVPVSSRYVYSPVPAKNWYA